MKGRTLTIRLQADWKAALRQAGAKAKARRYQGEELNFESPAAFFGRLTERRWELGRALQGQGPLAGRELSRPLGPGLKGGHGGLDTFVELWTLERAEGGPEVPV